MKVKMYAAVTSGTALAKVVTLSEERQQTMFPVVDNKESRRYLGYITLEDVTKHIRENPDAPITSGQILAQIIPVNATRLIHAHPDDSLEKSRTKIMTHGLQFLPVINDQGVFEGTVDMGSIAGAALATRSQPK